jgi:hypothetical protein
VHGPLGEEGEDRGLDVAAPSAAPAALPATAAAEAGTTGAAEAGAPGTEVPASPAPTVAVFVVVVFMVFVGVPVHGVLTFVFGSATRSVADALTIYRKPIGCNPPDYFAPPRAP